MNPEQTIATERHILHFSAAPIAQDEAPLFFNLGAKQYRLQPHTKATRSDARVENPYLQLLQERYFNHYLEVDLPADSVNMTFVTQEVQIDGESADSYRALSLHVPRQTQLLYEEKARRKNMLTLHPKLSLLLQAGNLQAPKHISGDLLHDVLDPFDTAVALMFQHPGLINLNGEQNGEIPQIIRNCIVSALKAKSLIVSRIAKAGKNWSFPIPLMDDGKQVIDEDGKLAFTLDLDQGVKNALAAPLMLALKTSQQIKELQGQTWSVQYGETTESHDAVHAASLRSSGPLLHADQTKWVSKSLTTTDGIKVEGFSYHAPQPGGWSIKEIWSNHEGKALISEEFLHALAAGDAYVMVNQRRSQFAASDIKENTAATLVSFNDAQPQYKVSLYLTAQHDELEISIEKTALAEPHPGYQIEVGYFTPDRKRITSWEKSSIATSSYGELRTTIRNDRLRHLSVYAEFFDTAGKAIEVKDWPDQMKDPTTVISKLFDNHNSKRYIGLLGPVDTVFGIPLPPDAETFNIPFPQSATSMRLYWGGLGTGKYDATVCACGITSTAVFELAIPVMLLAYGASQVNTVIVNDMVKPYVIKNAIFMIGAALAGAGKIAEAQDSGRAAKQVAAKLGPALATRALKVLAIYMAAKAVEGTARRSIPLINLAFLALDAVVTGLQLGQTTAAILQSPFYYETEFTRSFDLQVTIKPDPNFNKFPDYHDLLRVQVIYDSNATLPLSESSFRHRSHEVMSDPIPIDFKDIPAGGKIRVLAFFYAESGWQSATASTAWIDAKGGDGTAVLKIELTMKNALIPLSKDSVLQHRQKIVYENAKHTWKATPPPTATITTAGAGSGHRILSWTGITVAQKPAMLGYSWQATGTDLPRDYERGDKTAEALYTVQNLSLLQDAEARYAVAPAGFTNQSGVTYDLAGAVDGSGKSFWIDASKGNYHAETNPAGGFHLRHVALSLDSTPQFKADTGKSWGRFSGPIDSFVYHPQGYIAGVAIGSDKLFLLKLPEVAGPDESATVASLASGEGSRDGLLLRPKAVAVALDGRLLVLEDGNQRIQSFDVFGNPVRYFSVSGSTEKSPVLALRKTGASSTTYLDLSVEAKGYIFVLCYTDDGATAAQYRIDIYEPNGSFLVATPGVAAAKLAVDLARNVYTLNWEALTGRNGRTEPSVSHWIPPAPKVGDAKGDA